MSKYMLGVMAISCVGLLFGATSSRAEANIVFADSYAAASAATENTQAPLSCYEHLLLDPVDITVADGEHWQGVSDEMRADAVRLVHDNFVQAISSQLPANDGKEGAALRLHLTVEDVKLSSTLKSAVNHLLPIGLVVNAGRSAAGADAPKSMGSVTITGELRDAQTGALVKSFWTQQGPDPLNFGAAFSQQSAMKAAIERTAGRFTEALEKARKEGKVCAAG